MEFLKNHEIQLSFDSSGVKSDHILSSSERRNLLLVVKEALNNIVKHAEANQVKIDISTDAEQINILVVDDGVGIKGGNALGNGLENMNERMESIGGTFKIAEQQKGTTLILNLGLNNHLTNSL